MMDTAAVARPNKVNLAITSLISLTVLLMMDGHDGKLG
jgi:hypothetical protein